MKNIAVVYGGYSGESVISKKSADMILKNIDKNKFTAVPIEMTRTNWTAHLEKTDVEVDKNDFSVTVSSKKILFDVVFNIIHGTPGEDGLFQGYLSMLGIKHTTGDTFNMALTFNKAANNNYLAALGYNCAKSIILRKTDHFSVTKIVESLGLPIFIKPNEGGSSLGISKINDPSKITSAVELAFNESHEVILEEFISGREVTCGVISKNGNVTALPITEIITESDFFDYEAKYQGKSQEITPADIPEVTAQQLQRKSEEIYELLQCRGMIRIDYLLNEKGPYLIEVNTVPGFSDVSIVPQQGAAAGLSTKDLITYILDSAI